MTFDPFGDFATEGYLRNVEKEKDLDIVKRLEHTSFTTGLDEAFTALGKSRQVSYPDVLQTHGILFNAVYPWAGQDRLAIAPTLSVRKGPVIFANPSEIRPAVEFALTKEIDAPSRGHLDNYLEQFIRKPIAHEELAAQVIQAPGIDGRMPEGDENEVVGNVDAPEVKAQYEAMLLKRGKKI